jgi:hypothetical protein
MEEFADVAKARASWKAYVEALSTGRDIMRRAGVADPPPIPEFDTVFRRLSPQLRRDLYAALNEQDAMTPSGALEIWQPLMRKAFGGPKHEG